MHYRLPVIFRHQTIGRPIAWRANAICKEKADNHVLREYTCAPIHLWHQKGTTENSRTGNSHGDAGIMDGFSLKDAN